MFRVIILLALLLPHFAIAKLTPDLKAGAVILINAESGAILYEKNAHQLNYPASTTKIATAMYSLKLQGHKLDTILKAEHHHVAWVKEEAKERSNYTIPSYYLVPGASHMGLLKGEEMKFRDLLYGMMINSADDASNVIAQYIGGTIPNFMNDLNVYLRELGCHNTHFMNPHGLHHPKHQTTAYDMAIMTREALKNEIFCDMISRKKYPRPPTNKQKATTLAQTNHLVRNGKYHYHKSLGGKTGYTSKAGYNLVSAARDGDRTLIAVMLKCPSRDTAFKETVKLFELAFEEAKVQKTILAKGTQKPVLTIENGSTLLRTYTKEPGKFSYYPSEEPKVKCLVYWDELTLPVEQDQRVGELRIQDNHEIVYQKIPLYAQNRVNEKFMSRMGKWFNSEMIFKSLMSLLGIGLILFLLFQLKR